MSLLTRARSPWPERILSLVRIAAGLMFMTAGTMKLFGWPPSPQPMPPLSLTSQLGIAGLLETVGGALIVPGIITRPVAFILSGEMAVAYFQAHAPNGFFPVANGGIPAVLYCWLFLYLAVSGGGPWSIDAWLFRRRMTDAEK